MFHCVIQLITTVIDHLFFMPRSSTGPKIFFARPKIDLHLVPVPNFLCQIKKLFTFITCPSTGSKMFCASPKHFVLHQKMIFIQ